MTYAPQVRRTIIGTANSNFNSMFVLLVTLFFAAIVTTVTLTPANGLQISGAQCSFDGECDSGLCLGGYCCTSSDRAEMNGCLRCGSGRTAPCSECAVGYRLEGNGCVSILRQALLRAAGEECASSDECVSRSCKNGRCCDGHGAHMACLSCGSNGACNRCRPSTPAGTVKMGGNLKTGARKCLSMAYPRGGRCKSGTFAPGFTRLTNGDLIGTGWESEYDPRETVRANGEFDLIPFCNGLLELQDTTQHGRPVWTSVQGGNNKCSLWFEGYTRNYFIGLGVGGDERAHLRNGRLVLSRRKTTVMPFQSSIVPWLIPQALLLGQSTAGGFYPRWQPARCAFAAPGGSACVRNNQCNSGQCTADSNFCCSALVTELGGCNKCDGEGACSACKRGYSLVKPTGSSGGGGSVTGGYCVAEFEDGMRCAHDAECASGHCLSGVCCAAHVDADAQCTQCSVGSGACAACAGDFRLDTNQRGGTCVSEKEVDGGACRSDSDCASGSCRNSICCSSAGIQAGTHCVSCQFKVGTCSKCRSGYYLRSRDGLCAPLLSAGTTCVSNDDCASGTCDATRKRCCPIGCLSCLDATRCSSCDDTHLLSGASCLGGRLKAEEEARLKAKADAAAAATGANAASTNAPPTPAASSVSSDDLPVWAIAVIAACATLVVALPVTVCLVKRHIKTGAGTASATHGIGGDMPRLESRNVVNPVYESGDAANGYLDVHPGVV
eukprot:UC1_evm2s708